MHLSILIPTCNRPAKLANCVRALAAQSLSDFEVLIGIDGPDSETEPAARRAWSGLKDNLHIFALAKQGQASIRNHLLKHARARTLIFLNDDMIPDRLLLETHLRHQREQEQKGRAALIVGDAPWKVHGEPRATGFGASPTPVQELPNATDADPTTGVRKAGSPCHDSPPDSLFDRLIRETSMVFFYNVMNASNRSDTKAVSCTSPERSDGPAGIGAPERSPVTSFRARSETAPADRDWGFRHAWLLNLSAPAALIREVGGFTVFPSTYGYEDDELAFRLAQRFQTPVLFRPDAIATHDHRLTTADYLQREYNLGFAAWGFATTTPDCARAMFHREILSPDELDYSRAVLDREAGTARRLEKSFTELASLPANTIDGPHAESLLNLLYEHHLPLKRYHWRRGIVAAAGQSQR